MLRALAAQEKQAGRARGREGGGGGGAGGPRDDAELEMDALLALRQQQLAQLGCARAPGALRRRGRCLQCGVACRNGT